MENMTAGLLPFLCLRETEHVCHVDEGSTEIAINVDGFQRHDVAYKNLGTEIAHSIYTNVPNRKKKHLKTTQ